MIMAPEWQPDLYLRFADERLRPALDLMTRLPDCSPRTVFDLGCGAGNVTRLLARRFPSAEIVGIDSSIAMLERARQLAPECRFEQADLATWQPRQPPDLIFSNAALHWLQNHETLLPRLLRSLAANGLLAIQMPAMHDAPLREMQAILAARAPWRERLAGINSAPPILEPEAYWDLLGSLAGRLELWETIYWHRLRGEDAVAHWAAGSSLRPYLDPLSDAERASFLAEYALLLRPHYPPRADGSTWLPFRRLFLAAEAAR
jgi:trans-aconitate 2-methyltransferase